MKNNKARLVLGILLLTGIIFTACHNSLMESWWDDPDTRTPTHPAFYTVTFDTNRGTDVPELQLLAVAHGEKIARMMPLSREGFAFRGWFRILNGNFGAEWNFATDTVTSNITLRAEWVAIEQIVVSFDAGSGNPPPPSQSLTSGARVVEPPPMSRPGYGFAGWYRDSTYDNLWDFTKSLNEASVNSSFTLYARWVETEFHTIRFEANGGTPPPIDQRVASGVGNYRVVLPLPMSRTGFAFGGWYTEPLLLNKWDFDDPVTGPMTLYARWEPDQFHNVSFVTNGGFPVPSDQSVADNSRAVRPEAVSRTDFSFAGWFADGASTEWDFANDTVTSSLTLSAKWEPITYVEVIFEHYGGDLSDVLQRVALNSTVVEPPPMSLANNGFAGWYTDREFKNQWNFANPVTGVDVLVLHAKWEPAYHTVKFDAGDPSLPLVQDQMIAYNSRIVEPPPMNLAGSGFAGWFTTSDFAPGSQWNFTNSVVTKELTLYAKWEGIFHTVTFVPTGGTPVPAVQLIADNSRIVEPLPISRVGYSFVGWFTPGNVKWDFNNSITGDMTLTARWVEIECAIVEFISNGGSPAPAMQRIYKGTRIVPPPPMTRPGHGFAGWYKESTLDNLWDFSVPVDAGTLTLYAKWETIYHTVTFDTGDASLTMQSQQIVSGSRLVEPPPMNRPGYGFAGWFTNPDLSPASQWDFADSITGNLTLYAKWETYQRSVTFIANGGTPVPLVQSIFADDLTTAIRPASMTRTGFSFAGWFVGNTNDEWDFTDPVTDNLILTAKWEPIENVYIVTYNADGGSPAPVPQIYAQGARVVEPPAMRRTGLGFAGWYIDENLEYKFQFGHPIGGDLNLYAKWDTLHCTVTFVSNGGSPEPRTQDLTVGAEIIEPQTMSRHGFGFGGWFTDRDFNNRWDFSQTVPLDEENITLYARWVTNYYDVRFEANGGSPAPLSQRVAHGSTLDRPPTMSRPHEDFLGWYTSNPDSSNFDPNSKWNFSTDVVDREGIVLYAMWGVAEHIVRFNLKLPPGTPPITGPGNPVPEDQFVTIDSRILEPDTVNAAGWSFYGWFYSLRGDTFDPYNAMHRSELIEWDFNQPLIENLVQSIFVEDDGVYYLTLYARWVPFEPDMVWVRSGSFLMGAAGTGTSPARGVKLDGFYMGRYPVTQDGYRFVLDWVNQQWDLSLNSNPSQFQANQPTRPVDRVSWYDAVAYSNWRSMQENLTPVYSLDGRTNPADWGPRPVASPSNWDNMVMNTNANGYRLPTEAEWEYAAKGGNGSPGNFVFAGSDNADDVAWYNNTSSSMTHPVGTKAPNGLGIFDLNGNVMEWCWDWYASQYYRERLNDLGSVNNLDNNPVGPETGVERVRRGGSWNNAINNVRNVARSSFPPDNSTWVMGFRVVRGPSEIW